jgi:hypothetical protein
MDDNDVKFMPGDIIEQLFEDRTAGNGIDMGRFPFFAVNADWLPTAIFTKFPEQSLLSIQRMSINLG